MNHVLRKVVFPTILCVFVASKALASVTAIPLPELVKTSDAIITGRIIKMEKTEIREGVHEVICHIRVDSVLKGKPKTQDITILKKTFATVPIQFYDGKQVPSGKVVYGLGQEGIWFLYSIKKAKVGLYGAGAHRDLSSLDEVKKELQDQGVQATR